MPTTLYECYKVVEAVKRDIEILTHDRLTLKTHVNVLLDRLRSDKKKDLDRCNVLCETILDLKA
jgi:hypothetical protein